MISPMIVLFLLGVLQGAIGWLMVKSGLVPEKFYVGHVELATHFVAAVILLVYTLWFALGLLLNFKQKLLNAPIKNLLVVIALLLLIQLIYGGFMAGLRAGQTAPTWPSINHAILPPGIMEMQPASSNFFNNPLMVHFIHRGIAYLLFILAIVFFFVSKNITENTRFVKYRLAFIVLVLCQVLLGIVTVLNAANPKALVVLGVLHQFVAILAVMALTTLLFLVTKKSTAAVPV